MSNRRACWAEVAVEIAEAKRRVCAEVDRLAPVLLDVSHRIHARPELGFQEHFAHDLLSDVLAEARAGRATAGPTASTPPSRPGAGSGAGPVASVVCEYDALPGIGHACGHNIIAAAGLGAGLASATVAEQADGRLAGGGNAGRGGRRRQGAHAAATVPSPTPTWP